MNKDYLNKQPTKNEKILMELAYKVDVLFKRAGMWDNVSNLLIALARLNVSPETLAKTLEDVVENEKFVSKLNQETTRLIESRVQVKKDIKEKIEADLLPKKNNVTASISTK